MIEKSSVFHQAKSHYAYCYDENTLHITIKTKKDNIKKIYLYGGDPFDYEIKNNTMQWVNQVFSMHKYQSSSIYDYWIIAISPLHRRFSYLFQLISSNQTLLYTEKGFYAENENDDILKTTKKCFNFPWMNKIDILTYPTWIKSAIWYQIFPDRFCRDEHYLTNKKFLPWSSAPPTSNNFFGENLQGIINKLDYLCDLGINAIYLNPIFKSPSNHKYDTIDYFNIDPSFGTNKLFKELVIKCHQKDIKIMLDGVFNHISWNHFAWQDVLKKQQKSRYKEWFHIKNFPIRVPDNDLTKLNYATFGYSSLMPKLNTENIAVQKYLLKIAVFWIKKYNIDGWRMDVANEIDHSFWRYLRTTVKKNKNVYLLAETWNIGLPWINGDQFDGVMNYVLYDLILEYFVLQKITLQDFTDKLKELFFTYPDHTWPAMFNCLDSHDTPRLLTLTNHNVAIFKISYLFLFLCPGSPSIYYGDEIGLDGENDPLCRKCMIWDKEKWNFELITFLKKIIDLRKKHPILGNDGDLIIIDNKNILIFYKQKDNTKYLIVINNTNKTQDLDLPL